MHTHTHMLNPILPPPKVARTEDFFGATDRQSDTGLATLTRHCCDGPVDRAARKTLRRRHQWSKISDKKNLRKIFAQTGNRTRNLWSKRVSEGNCLVNGATDRYIKRKFNLFNPTKTLIDLKNLSLKQNIFNIVTCHFGWGDRSGFLDPSRQLACGKGAPTSLVVVRGCALHLHAADSATWVGVR